MSGGGGGVPGPPVESGSPLDSLVVCGVVVVVGSRVVVAVIGPVPGSTAVVVGVSPVVLVLVLAVPLSPVVGVVSAVVAVVAVVASVLVLGAPVLEWLVLPALAVVVPESPQAVRSVVSSVAERRREAFIVRR